jgi:hypothetical protein
MAIDSVKKSSRFLQSRRYTHETLLDSQEAFTSTLDINSSEVYTDAALIPSSSLPFSGSSQDLSVYSSGGKQVMKYYYRKKLTKSDLNNEVWFFTTPSGSSSGIGAQLLDAGQQGSFVSPKYSVPALSNANTEDNPAGYLAKVFVSTNASTPAAGDQISVNNYAFDYKTGVLEFSSSAVMPSNSQYVYVSVYQYVGSTLTTSLGSLTGSFTGSFFGNGAGITNISASSINDLNLFRIATGSISASVNVGPTVFTITSASSTLFSLSNSGSITVNATGSVPHFFLITSGSKNVFKINNEGTVENKVFESGYVPAAQYGGIYFTSQSVFVGLDEATFS